ncbi:conserved hypothetical protein [Trichinella spiralis]|uniref:hypothetical protein n=1 Tax=Trichinella spiralis TaxID=6334 RepID=UPI0001EFBDB2|nr:conserved hypothetical protein [Trichinella spiralis]
MAAPTGASSNRRPPTSVFAVYAAGPCALVVALAGVQSSPPTAQFARHILQIYSAKVGHTCACQMNNLLIVDAWLPTPGWGVAMTTCWSNIITTVGWNNDACSRLVLVDGRWSFRRCWSL